MQKVESRRHVKNNNESVEEESPRQALKMKNVEDESRPHGKNKSKT